MKNTMLLLASLLFPFLGNSQIYINSQSEIDNFSITHPETTLNSYIHVFSSAITNLDGLMHLDSITEFIYIRETSIENLNGLQNLKYVRALYIQENDKLSDFSKITHLAGKLNNLGITASNLDTFPLFPNLHTIGQLSLFNNDSLVDISNLGHLNFNSIKILNNPDLSVCSNPALCDHLTNFRDYQINANGSGCKTREEILSSCTDYIPCEIDQESITIDFNDWTDEGIPHGLIGTLDSIELQNTTSVNISKSPPIDDLEGHSMKLTTYINPTSALIEGKISFFAYQPPETINISFDYCFENPMLPLGNFFGLGNILIDDNIIWNSYVTSSGNISCDNPVSVELCNVPVPLNSDTILITFENELLWSSVDAIFASSWIIDNIKISDIETISNIINQPEVSEILVFPNPTENEITIESSTQYSNYKVLDMLGNVLSSGNFESSIDFSPFHPGVYFLVLYSGDDYSLTKIVKK